VKNVLIAYVLVMKSDIRLFNVTQIYNSLCFYYMKVVVCVCICSAEGQQQVSVPKVKVLYPVYFQANTCNFSHVFTIDT